MKILSTIVCCLCVIICFSQSTTNHITITRNHSKCIINEENVELIPSGRYADIWTAYDSLGKYFVVTNFTGKKGIYELGNKEVVPCIYDHFRLFNNTGFAEKEEKWAVISGDFKMISDFKFDNPSHFSKDKTAVVKQNGQWILIDSKGETIKQLPFDEIHFFSSTNSYTVAGINKKYGIINRNYDIVVPLEYEEAAIALNDSNDIFPVKKAGRWGYVNKQNNIVVPFKYAYTTPVYDGFGLLKNNDYKTTGAVNGNGQIMFDDKRFTDIEYAHEGKLIYTTKHAATNKILQGYLDSASFGILIKAQFEDAGHFHNGRAIVKKNGLYGVIDENENVIISYLYESMSRWVDNYVVKLNGKSGMIDKHGNIVTPLQYESIGYSGSTATIIHKGLSGLLHNNGKVLVSPLYSEVRAISEKAFYAVKGNQKFILYADGTQKSIE